MKLNHVKIFHIASAAFFVISWLIIEASSTVSWWFILLEFLALLVFFSIHIRYWRCPHCARHLGRSNGEYCPHCGKNLYSE